MTIFYYTATGNSLEIANKLGGTVISIPSVIKGDVYEFEDDVIGIVVPNHHADIPEIVKQFLRKTRLRANYFFGIITYGEMNADTNWRLYQYGKQNKIKFNYINSIKMVDNSFVYWDIAKQIKNLPQKKVNEHFIAIEQDIRSHTNDIKGSGIKNRLIGSLARILPHETKHHKRFFIEKEKCVNCGVCLKVCPINNIIIEANTPKILERCVRCGACTHNCPKNAIRYKGEKSKARYRNEKIKLIDIIRANNTIYKNLAERQ